MSRIVRRLRYETGPEEEGCRVKSVLRLRGFSKTELMRLKLIPECVTLDGRPVRLIDRLPAAAVLEIAVPEEEKEELAYGGDLRFEILYEDEDLLIVNKPAGMPTHPSGRNRDNSLAAALSEHFRKRGAAFVFRCSNRLDESTSGLLPVAKNRLCAGMLSEMGARREIRREYLAVIRGELTPPEGTVDAPLARLPGPLLVQAVDPVRGRRAVTHYRTLAVREGLSLLSVVLETGRTHQIRVHMKHLGHPLLGDSLYNPDDDRSLIGRQALHARRLTFTHPITGCVIDAEAPLPADLSSVLEYMNIEI